MAKITSLGNLKGTVGPVSYRVVNGQPTVQANPGRGNVKQSEKTKQSGSDFGRSSRTSKAIRRTLYPVVRDFEDASFYRRMTGIIADVIRADKINPAGKRQVIDGDLSLMANIVCNNKSEFSDYCRVQIDGGLNADGSLSLSLPNFSIKEQVVSIKNASHATLCYLVVCINPETLVQSYAELFDQSFKLQINQVEAVNWNSEILPAGHIVVISSAVLYYRNNNLAGMICLNNKDFHPCEVTAVLHT